MWVDDLATQQALPIGSARLSTDAVDRCDSATRADAGVKLRVPRQFVEIATLAACHRRADKWRLLYQLLWRIMHENRRLLEVASDEDAHAVEQMAAQVR